MAATRQLINIPNHPTLTDVTRKVAIIKSQPYYKYNGVPEGIGHFKKSISLDLLVLHFDKNGDYFKLGNNDGVVYISSDESDYINPQTFEKVEKDENGEYPAGSALEYDVLWDIVYTSKSQTDLELQETFVLLRLNNINDKLYK